MDLVENKDHLGMNPTSVKWVMGLIIVFTLFLAFFVNLSDYTNSMVSDSQVYNLVSMLAFVGLAAYLIMERERHLGYTKYFVGMYLATWVGSLWDNSWRLLPVGTKMSENGKLTYQVILENDRKVLVNLETGIKYY